MANSSQTPPPRSKQRLQNFKKAFAQLEKFVQQEKLNELEEQGLIQAFEYTYELAWKLLQDVLREQGFVDVAGPRPSIEQAFQVGLIQDGLVWMQMLKDRNLTTHTYNEAVAQEILSHIRSEFIESFRKLKLAIEDYQEKQVGK